MSPASRTPEGEPNTCPVCGGHLRIEPSASTGDAPCPNCGWLLWFPARWRLDDLGSPLPVYQIASAGYTKERAIRAVLNCLIEDGRLNAVESEDILAEILKREEIGSTAIGRGIAIPHTKHATLKQIVAAIATLSDPVDFGGADGVPARVVCLLVTPADKSLEALEAISRRLRTLGA